MGLKLSFDIQSFYEICDTEEYSELTIQTTTEKKYSSSR